MTHQSCPYKIGDLVRFVPSERSVGWTLSFDQFAIEPNGVYPIDRIEEETFLYFHGGTMGWHWSEFELVRLEPEL